MLMRKETFAYSHLFCTLRCTCRCHFTTLYMDVHPSPLRQNIYVCIAMPMHKVLQRHFKESCYGYTWLHILISFVFLILCSHSFMYLIATQSWVVTFVYITICPARIYLCIKPLLLCIRYSIMSKHNSAAQQSLCMQFRVRFTAAFPSQLWI